jgi:hypothetical protein
MVTPNLNPCAPIKLGQLVAELQRVVVRVHVRHGGPLIAHLAAPHEDVGWQLRTGLIREPREPLEGDAAAPCAITLGSCQTLSSVRRV